MFMFEVCRMKHICARNLIIAGRYIIYKEGIELHSVKTGDYYRGNNAYLLACKTR
jgi:hypothetical protein